MTCLLQLSRRREWGYGCSWHFASSFGDIILKMGCDDIIWLHVKNKACKWGACSSPEFLFIGSNDAFLGIAVFATAAYGDQQGQKCQRVLIPDRHMQTFCWQSMPRAFSLAEHVILTQAVQLSLDTKRVCDPSTRPPTYFISWRKRLYMWTLVHLCLMPKGPLCIWMRHILLSSSVCILIRYR